MEEDNTTKLYQESSKRLEDEKSTYATFLLVGVAGLILTILFAAGVLPIAVADYMKIILSVFMGILFLIFIVIGIMSYQKTKQLKSMAETERMQNEQILSWLGSHVTKEELEQIASSKESEEDAYFLHSEYLKTKLSEEFQDISTEYAEFILDEFYDTLYPQQERSTQP